MTTLQAILDDRFSLIESKEALIRQLQDEIAQARLFTQAAEGVSSTLDNAKELFFNAMCSFYSLMQHEPADVREQTIEKIWDDFEQLDVQAQQHVANRKSLVSEGISEEVFDNNLSESDANPSDNLSESDTSHTPTDGTDSVSVSDVGASLLQSEEQSERKPSPLVEEIVSDSSRTVVVTRSDSVRQSRGVSLERASQLSDTIDVGAVQVESTARLLVASELKKDQVDWTTLKALARNKGVTAKKRPEIEAALIELGVTAQDLEAVTLEF